MEFNKIISCNTTNEIWDKLQVIHDGINQVQETHINMLVYQFELFYMKEIEMMSEMNS